MLKQWVQLLRPYWATFLSIQLFTRVFLLFYSDAYHTMTLLEGVQVFACGFVFDLLVALFFMVPLALGHMIVRHRSYPTKFYRIGRYVSFMAFTYTWLFTAVAEYYFWQEFSTRFNFIAVDYLVYTQEVIGNVRESYPLPELLSGIAVITVILTYLWRKVLTHPPSIRQSFRFRLAALGIIALPFVLNFFVSTNIIPNFADNQAEQELARNGTYSFFSAYQNNELDFKGFYMVKPEQQVAGHIRELLAEDENQFASKDPEDITRIIRRKGPEIHKNVVMVVMESMGADFMREFGDGTILTPNLDRLSNEGLFLSKLYATGTRTVRGLEALSLSIPPTPGQSILRRKNNGDLFTIGSVFADRGYDTAFIYGGHGYFDNMNAYFSANGFRIVDRASFPEDKIIFSNVWGVSDEDLYNKVMEEADRNVKNKKKFFYMVMTTSNHRPYTFPEGRIKRPSKGGGRYAGVEYADYAIGKFIKDAQKKSWFKDTVFIFVADHTSGAGGHSELSVVKYHIPAIFYAPGFIKKQRYDLTASQIDVPPTLLGLLNFSYATKFFGEDLLHDSDEAEHPHAFISNYQKIGLLQKDKLSVLEPKRIYEEYIDDKEVSEADEDPRLLLDTVTYYQYASGWRERMKRIPSVLPPERK